MDKQTVYHQGGYMGFYTRIKNDLLEIKNRRGLRRRVSVDAVALRELLDDYERLDSSARAHHVVAGNYAPLELILSETLRALYHKNHDSERLMLLVMEILKSMIEERVKRCSVAATTASEMEAAPKDCGFANMPTKPIDKKKLDEAIQSLSRRGRESPPAERKGQ